MTTPTAIRLPEIAGQIYDLLEPLDAPTRGKVLQGVLGLLGDAGTEAPQALRPSQGPAGAGGDSPRASGHASGPRGQAWVRKNDLTDERLERAFHFDGNVELIATPPGKNKREQTINAYVLVGAQHLLQSDDSKFSEAVAVALCKRFGCYDAANHALTRTKFGNKIQGSKDNGYSLTVPGLDQAAVLIKGIAS